MAYGTQVYHWRSYGNWTTSTSSKNFTVTLTVGMQSIAWGYNLGVIANANIDGTTNSVRSDFYAATGATVSKNMVTVSKTFTRGHSNVNKGLSWSIVNGSGYHNGTSTGSGTVTVPALASHTVTFDDNGGSEGPKSTTKWEFEDLTIPSTIPTRKNYEFLGWSRNRSSASAEYEAGKTYNGTKDENYTLYAIWKILYIPPSFSNALALRTASASSTTNNPDGVYGYASFTWNVDTSVYPDNVLNTIDIKYYQDDSTVGTAVTPSGITSGATGTVNIHFPAALSSVYSVVCTISDTQGGSVSIARSIGSGSIPIEVSNKGQSIGIMSSAPMSPGVKIGSSGTPSFEHFAETINGNLNSVVRIYGRTSSDDQGELTISTQGIDSSGNIAYGPINVIADSLKFNGNDITRIPDTPMYDLSTHEEVNMGNIIYLQNKVTYGIKNGFLIIRFCSVIGVTPNGVLLGTIPIEFFKGHMPISSGYFPLASRQNNNMAMGWVGAVNFDGDHTSSMDVWCYLMSGTATDLTSIDGTFTSYLL